MSEHEREAHGDEPPELIDLMIGAAGAGPDDRIVIAGSRLDLLIGLLRRGFAAAMCLAGQAPAGGEMPDILLIPDAKLSETPLTALPSLLRRLAPGGTAVLHCPQQGGTRRALQRLLRESGFAMAGERNCDQAVLLTARKPGALRLRQVA
jgi:hypothetical protein